MFTEVSGWGGTLKELKEASLVELRREALEGEESEPFELSELFRNSS